LKPLTGQSASGFSMTECVRLSRTPSLMFLASVFCTHGALGEEEHETHEQHRNDELSHNFLL
jgi:hypothetical protein